MNDHLPVIDYSVVIPVYNEAPTLPELCRRLAAVISSTRDAWEVVFVNDGSADNSLDILLDLRTKYPLIRVVDLSRNFGHQPALTAGLDHASGRAVILMDADLQDPPEALPRFIEHWRKGYQVVYALRIKRKEGLLLRWAFSGFYRIQTRISRVKTPLNAGIFSLIDRAVINTLSTCPNITGIWRACVPMQDFGKPESRSSAGPGPMASRKSASAGWFASLWMLFLRSRPFLCA